MQKQSNFDEVIAWKKKYNDQAHLPNLLHRRQKFLHHLVRDAKCPELKIGKGRATNALQQMGFQGLTIITAIMLPMKHLYKQALPPARVCLVDAC